MFMYVCECVCVSGHQLTYVQCAYSNCDPLGNLYLACDWEEWKEKCYDEDKSKVCVCGICVCVCVCAFVNVYMYHSHPLVVPRNSFSFYLLNTLVMTSTYMSVCTVVLQ